MHECTNCNAMCECDGEDLHQPPPVNCVSNCCADEDDDMECDCCDDCGIPGTVPGHCAHCWDGDVY